MIVLFVKVVLVLWNEVDDDDGDDNDGSDGLNDVHHGIDVDDDDDDGDDDGKYLVLVISFDDVEVQEFVYFDSLFFD